MAIRECTGVVLWRRPKSLFSNCIWCSAAQKFKHVYHLLGIGPLLGVKHNARPYKAGYPSVDAALRDRVRVGRLGDVEDQLGVLEVAGEVRPWPGPGGQVQRGQPE